MTPAPVQRPRIPLWLAARTTNAAPLRRAARYDGLCVIERSPVELAAMIERIVELRGNLDGFDVAMMLRPGMDPAPYLASGATWVINEIGPACVGGRCGGPVGRRPPGLSVSPDAVPLRTAVRDFWSEMLESNTRS